MFCRELAAELGRQVFRDFEGTGRGHMVRRARKESCRLNQTIIAYRYSLSRMTYKVEEKRVRERRTWRGKPEREEVGVGSGAKPIKTKRLAKGSPPGAFKRSEGRSPIQSRCDSPISC